MERNLTNQQVNGWVISGLVSALCIFTAQSAEAGSLVYQDGFGSGEKTLGTGITATWSNAQTETSPLGETFLGRFTKNSNQTSLALQGLGQTAKTVTVQLDLYLLGSWDGSHAIEGDSLQMSVRGGNSLLDASFSTSAARYTDKWQSFSPDDPLGTGQYAPGTMGESYNSSTQSFNRNVLGYVSNTSDPYRTNDDKNLVYRDLTFTFDYREDFLALDFLSRVTARDESFGLDNVRIWVDEAEANQDVPEPTMVLALLGVGTGMAWAKRKRG